MHKMTLNMSTTIRSALSYFAIVFGTGFILGMFRVPILVPRIGEQWAELAEMPIMATVIFFSAGHILKRFPSIRSPGRSLAAGFLALALSVAAESGLAALFQHQSLSEFIKSRGRNIYRTPPRFCSHAATSALRQFILETQALLYLKRTCHSGRGTTRMDDACSCHDSITTFKAPVSAARPRVS